MESASYLNAGELLSREKFNDRGRGDCVRQRVHVPMVDQFVAAGSIPKTSAKRLAIVSVNEGRPTVRTPAIAELFDRPHRSVVRSIDLLIGNGTIDAHSVVRISYRDSMNREQRGYELAEREALILMPFVGGRRSESGMVTLVDSFLKLRNNAFRLRQMRSDPDWQRARIEGKTARRAETDAIRVFVNYAFAQGSLGAAKYFLQITKAVNQTLFVVERNAAENVRLFLTPQQLAILAMAEGMVERALAEGMARKQYYKEIYQVAVERVRQFAALVGRSIPGNILAVGHND